MKMAIVAGALAGAATWGGYREATRPDTDTLVLRNEKLAACAEMVTTTCLEDLGIDYVVAADDIAVASDDKLHIGQQQIAPVLRSEIQPQPDLWDERVQSAIQGSLGGATIVLWSYMIFTPSNDFANKRENSHI
jgi:hypothetical protein